jgi:hypothetical protein
LQSPALQPSATAAALPVPGQGDAVAISFQTSSRASLSALAAQDGPGGYVISQTVDLVELPVTVRDSKGRFVSGPKQPNFRAYENGQMQEITLFRSEDIPVAAGLVVDHSGNMGSKREEVMEGSKAFVQASNPEGREFVVSFRTPGVSIFCGTRISTKLNQAPSPQCPSNFSMPRWDGWSGNPITSGSARPESRSESNQAFRL